MLVAVVARPQVEGVEALLDGLTYRGELEQDAGAVVLLVRLALRTVGWADWFGLLAGPAAGSAAMAAAILGVGGPLAVTLAAGALAYLLGLVLVELLVSPGDLKLSARVLRRRIGHTTPL